MHVLYVDRGAVVTSMESELIDMFLHHPKLDNKQVLPFGLTPDDPVFVFLL